MVTYVMMTPLSPEPSDAELLKAFSKKRTINQCLKDIKLLFINSYRSGHKGLDKQMAYVGTNKLLKRLDMYMVEVFNELTYGKR